MTFSQLRTFALVAELGSLRAAAAALGVSEPAVSAAVAALRTDLGDPLFRSTGSGIALTPGGRALATRARELVRLADRTRREVAHATSTGRLRVLATAACAEHVAGTVVYAFTRRVPRAAVDLTVGSTDCAAVALADDDADIVLGVRPAPSPGHPLESVPFLRYQRVLVAAPGPPAWPAASGSPVTALAGQRWLAGPAGLEPGSEEERWADGTGLLPEIQRCESEAEALAAVRGGEGVLLALEHTVRDDLRRAARWSACPSRARRSWACGGPACPAAGARPARHGRCSASSPLPTRRARCWPARTGRPAPRPTVRVELWS